MPSPRDPTRETAQRALMTTLARSGDFSASVEAYQRLRIYLRENMNLEPDAETQRLMQQIREQARRSITITPPGGAHGQWSDANRR